MRRVLQKKISDPMLTEWFQHIPTCFKCWTPPPHEPWIYWHVRCLHEVHSSGREPWDPLVKLCFRWGHEWHERNSGDFKGHHCEQIGDVLFKSWRHPWKHCRSARQQDLLEIILDKRDQWRWNQSTGMWRGFAFVFHRFGTSSQISCAAQCKELCEV